MLCRPIIRLLLLVLPLSFVRLRFLCVILWLRTLPRRRLMSSPLFVAPTGVPREGKATVLVVVPCSPTVGIS